jgi:hypothetical protein
VPAGNQLKTSKTLRSWLKSFIGSIHISLGGDWWTLDFGFRFKLDIVYWFVFLWISGRYKWCRHRFLPPTTEGRISPCTEFAVSMSIMALIGCGTYQVLQRCTQLILILFVVFLAFMYVYGSPGGLQLERRMM